MQNQIVNKDALREVEIHTFDAEASEIGWRPGYFPRMFAVKPEIGNGLEFVMRATDSGAATYEQVAGCVRIVVWND